MTTVLENESLIDHSKPSAKDAGMYGTVPLSDHEVASRSSYSEYHKVCDMRRVFDTSAIGLAGIMLTFLVIFTSWCALHESVEWIGDKLSYDGSQLVQFAAKVNSIAAAILIGLMFLMRYTVGPILSLSWRGVFAILLVLTAITLWEAFEATVDLLVGSDSGDRSFFYVIACAASILLMVIFEVVFQYDVIGNHLVVPP